MMVVVTRKLKGLGPQCAPGSERLAPVARRRTLTRVAVLDGKLQASANAGVSFPDAAGCRLRLAVQNPRLRGPGSLPEQHDLSEGERIGVSDGHQRSADVHGLCPSLGPAVELKPGRPAGTDDLDVLPQHPSRVARAERLHRGFLGCEPAGQVRHRVPAPRTIGNLAVGEHAAHEAFAVPLEDFRDPWDICRVESDSQDIHVRASA